MARCRFNLLLIEAAAVASIVAAGVQPVSEESGLYLLQHQSHIDEVTDTSTSAAAVLPDVKSMLDKPHSILSKMNTNVDAFKQRLDEVQHKTNKELDKQRAHLEKNLTAQQAEIRAIGELNTQISGEISALDLSNVFLRSQAQDYSHRNSGLVAILRSLQGNMSMAQEYVSIAVNRSSELLDSAPELQVMSELAKEDEERNRKAAFKDLVAAGRSMAAMQVDSAVHGHGKDKNDDDAQSLLNLMSGALNELAGEQRASEAALNDMFEKAFQKGTEDKARLLSKQAELNSTKAQAEELHTKLTEAVSHLEKANEYLQKQIDALRSFSSLLGKEPSQQKGVALLQVAADKDKDKLPDMKHVLRKPSAALDSVNHQVNELLNRLEGMHQQSAEVSSEQQKEYDRQLTELKSNISRQEQENTNFQMEIKQLDDTITSLRLTAGKMVANNKKLREDLGFIQANMTIAQEYLGQLLNDTHEPLAHTKDLKVLHELAQMDAAQKAEQAHEEKLKEVSVVALLQTQNVEEKQHGSAGSARDIISSLESSMDVLQQEHESSRAELQAAFEKEFRAHNKTFHKLVRQGHQLNETKAEKAEVQHKLQVAVKHLDHTGKTLAEKRAALLSFAGKLASLPSPVEVQSASDTSDAKSQSANLITFQKAYDILRNMSGIFSRPDGAKIKRSS